MTRTRGFQRISDPNEKQILHIYNGRHTLEAMSFGHKYLVDGEEKPGVTSIIAILNKPNLPQWASNQCVEYIVTHSEPFPEHLGHKAWIVTDLDLKAARKAFNSSRDASADLGKRVHSWIERHIKRRIEGGYTGQNYSDDMRPSITSFLKWEEEYSPEYVFSERIVFSERHGYCGTSDTCVMLTGKDGTRLRVNLDFKTGKPESEYDRTIGRYTGRKRPYTTVFIQNAMYDLAIEEEDGIRADRYAGLYISTNGDLLFGMTDRTESFRQLALNLVETHKSLHMADNLNNWM